MRERILHGKNVGDENVLILDLDVTFFDEV